MLSFLSNGLGDYLFGNFLGSNVSTMFILLAFLFQILTNSLRLPRILLGIYVYILAHLLLRGSHLLDPSSSLKHFAGFILYSLCIFSYVSVHRNKIVDIIRSYYYVVLIIGCIGILQVIAFVVLGVSFIPQNMISGTAVMGGRETFAPEMFHLFPRAVGLSTEPAHYAILMLPGVYIALSNVISRRQVYIGSRVSSYIVLFGFLLSFSIVGYFGLLLCILALFHRDLKGRFIIKLVVTVLFGGVIFLVSASGLSSKVTSFTKILSGITDFNYTSSDLTGFALASNLVVAIEGFKESKGLGTGINTHKDTYASTIYSKFSIEQVIIELNSADAGSLFIRVISEFGLFGIIAFILFCSHFKISGCPNMHGYFNGMSLVMLLSYSARNGNYISNFLIFFIALYYYSYKMHLQSKKESKPIHVVR